MLVNNRKIIQNIYGGKLQEKCQQCNTGIICHPALDFHHPYPKLKTQHIRFGHGKWEKERETLEMEIVNLEWKNCHNKDQTTSYYNLKKSIQRFNRHIQRRNLIPQEIAVKVGKFIKQQSTNINVFNRRGVKAWIGKSVVINILFNDTCVACKQIIIKSNLPDLQFHHKNLKNLNKTKQKALLYQPIPEFIKTLKNENCVSFYLNCQRMVYSP